MYEPSGGTMAQAGISHKFGWLRIHFGYFAAAAALCTSVAGAASILFADDTWAAIDFSNRCEARAKALWVRPKTQPFAGFAFDRAAARQGQFYVRLSRPARAGATVIAQIDGQPFLLAGHGPWAWSRGGEQQLLMLRMARYGQRMRVQSRDQQGRRFVDHYALGGAATAIDAAAAACAQAGKKR